MKKSVWAKIFGAISGLTLATCHAPGLEIGHVHGVSVNCLLAGLFAYLGVHNASNTGGPATE